MSHRSGHRAEFAGRDEFAEILNFVFDGGMFNVLFVSIGWLVPSVCA
jgi:hypothetical protein